MARVEVKFAGSNQFNDKLTFKISPSRADKSELSATFKTSPLPRYAASNAQSFRSLQDLCDQDRRNAKSYNHTNGSSACKRYSHKLSAGEVDKNHNGNIKGSGIHCLMCNLCSL